jgi:hypothetical protein
MTRKPQLIDRQEVGNVETKQNPKMKIAVVKQNKGNN